MKSKFKILCAISCAMLLSLNAFSQLDERQPGLYAIVGEQSIPLAYSNCTTNKNTINVLGFEIAKKEYSYKNPTSGINASVTFVLVIDPEQKAIIRTIKSYNPFIKTLTPDDMLIIPLSVRKNKRVYEEGKTYNGFNFTIKDYVEFEWEQISENSFEIRVKNIIPGEYGFILRPAKFSIYDYTAMFGFTYVE